MQTSRRHRRLLAAGLALPIALVALAGCSDDGDDDAASTTTEAVATTAAPDTTAAPETSSPDTTEVGKGKTEPVGPVDESDVDPWARSAQPYRGQIGDTVDFDCPAGGEPGTVWGTNVYTDDSSVCTAAVHVGLITFEDGGTVTIEIADGADEYAATENNGVTTVAYGSWGGSFTFPDADELEVPGIAWNRRAADYSDQAGEVITVTCSPDGEASAVWGTGTYTDDSSICTAAVHAGLITFADGGDVSFQLVDGLDSYEGSEANGVTSSDYGSWGGSFEFVDAP